jgi:hypothetical protein
VHLVGFIIRSHLHNFMPRIINWLNFFIIQLGVNSPANEDFVVGTYGKFFDLTVVFMKTTIS